MAKPIFNINSMALKAYDQLLKNNKTATESIGIDTIYCRLVPEKDGEDIIVQEYTLSHYDCPRAIKVVATNTDYNAGNFMIDAWGLHQELPFEINIDLLTWQETFGADTMPQKGDFLLLGYINIPYEITSSQVVKQIAQKPTMFKCVLGVWKNNANRKTSEEFQVSIDELTTSQERLFGDAISKEVADAVVEVETAYNTTTMADPIKDFTMESVTTEDIRGEGGNLIASAYYDFSKMDDAVTYRVGATYSPSSDTNHWIYTCWFRSDADGDTVKSAQFKFGELYLRERDFWYFRISGGFKVSDGDTVTIYRGSMLSMDASVIYDDGAIAFRISSEDCFRASKKVANWWASGAWRMQTLSTIPILSLLDGDTETFGIRVGGKAVTYGLGGHTLTVSIADGHSRGYGEWHYLMADVCPSGIRTLLVKNKTERDGSHSDVIVADVDTKTSIGGFSFDRATAGVPSEGLYMTNMRLYEDSEPMGDDYTLDMHARVTRNASKLIFVDSLSGVNETTFITPVR